MGTISIVERKRTLSEIEEFSRNAQDQSRLDERVVHSRNNIFLTSCLVGTTLIPSHEVIANNFKLKFDIGQSVQISEKNNEDLTNDIVKYIEEINSFSQQNYSKHALIKEVLSFKSLKENWDGYGAFPLEIESASNAIQLMDLIGDEIFCRTTNFFPNTNGTVTFEWENKEEEIVSVEIGNDHFSYFVEMASQEPLFFDENLFNAKEAKKLAQFIRTI